MTLLLGNQAVGPAAPDSFPGGNTGAWEFTAEADGDLATISLQLGVANPALVGAQVGVYSHDAANSRPLALLGSVAMAEQPVGTGLYTTVFPPGLAIEAGTAYWLAFFASGEPVNFNYLDGPASEVKYAGGAMPAGSAFTGFLTSIPIIYGESAEGPPIPAGGSLLALITSVAEALQPLTAEIADLTISPLWDDTPNPPEIDVYPGNPFQFGAGFAAGNNQVQLTVRARVSMGDPEAAQLTLLRLLDPDDPASVEIALSEVEGMAIGEGGVSGFTVYADDAPLNERLLGCEWRVTTFL